MSKIIDFTDVYQQTLEIKHILSLVEKFHPKIEQVIDEEINRLAIHPDIYEALRNSPNTDMSVISSLCFIIAQYLISLANKENSFNVSMSNIEIFSNNLLNGMIKIVKKDIK